MYAILRFQKKTGGKLLNTQKHNERQKERYKSNPDIDRERSDENIHLKAPPPGGYKRAVLERTEKAGCRLRKDSVMMIETLITASPELFREMSREEMMDFMKRAYTFVAERVGEDNIVSAVIHLDEKTPHMHLCFVPLTKDHRLCAKEILGNRTHLSKYWQDGFFEYMHEQYSQLERGEPAAETKRKHIPVWLYKKGEHLDRMYGQVKEILDNTNTFAIHLKHCVQDIPSAVVVQRLKRRDTIVQKLERFPTMKLYRMQDLGGCRVILPKVADVYDLVKQMRTSRIRHEESNYKDYIAIPNPDTGYRGYHLIYKYFSDRNTDYNGLKVEIQIRTKLQHIWATAVETVGVFTDNKLKFNSGSEDWLKFFKLTSGLFAIEERTAIPDGLPTDAMEIFDQWLVLLEKLDVISTLGTIGIATQKIGHIKKRAKKQQGYYIIKLWFDPVDVEIEPFYGKEKSLEAAIQAYSELESLKQISKFDCVLVSAQSYETLVDAYPNYFLDVKQFLQEVSYLLKKYSNLKGRT